MTTTMEFAERLAMAEQVVQSLGQMNQPADPKARLRADARYHLAIDALRKARQEYDEFIRWMSADELMRAARPSSEAPLLTAHGTKAEQADGV